MQSTISYMQLTNSNAIVQDDADDVENQQQFSNNAHNNANEFASKLKSLK